MTLAPRLTASLAAGALVTGALLLPGAATPAAAAPSAPGSAALTWLADQLDDAHGVFTFDSGFGPFTDYGLTLDADLALLLGGGHASSVTASLTAIEAHLADYVSHGDFGSGPGDSAGALAKVLLTEEIAGRPTTVSGIDLESRLRATLRPTTDARRAGRFDGDHGDFVNGVTHPLGVLALSRTTDGAPAASIAFLLAQQCANGGFRGDYDVFDPVTFAVDEAASTRGCTTDAEAQGDATAFALEALLANRNAPGAAAAITKAIAFLELPANAAADNANSAGLAGQALRAAGETGDADGFAARVLALQVAAGPNEDAIALDATTRADVEAADPLSEAKLALLVRSTTQGVLALGLGSYGPVVAPPTTSTTSSSTSSTTSSTSSSTSTTAASSTTAAAGASSTTSTTAAAGRGIPKTGSDTREQAAIALLLVGLGLAAVGAARRRDQRPS
jgi:hypothetical protein